MTQKGSHTWDLIVHYHRCPKCGYIIESRDDYIFHKNKGVKQLTCKRCNHAFEEIKMRKSSFGPLLGDPQPSEFDWS